MTKSADIISLATPSRVTGFQPVAAYEAGLIEEANQERLKLGERVGPRLAAMHAHINRLDFKLAGYASDLAHARRELAQSGIGEFFAPLNWVGFHLLTLLLICLETPVNKAALDFLRLQEWESYFLAVFFGLLNLLAAETSARVLRQNAWADKAWRSWTVAFAANAMLLAALWYVSELRGTMASGSSGPAVDSSFTFFALQLFCYVAVLLGSFLQINPSFKGEQLGKRIARLEKELGRVWGPRAQIAERYNLALTKANFELQSIIHDCLKKIAQFRDASMHRLKDSAPSYFHQAVASQAFLPIHLGVPIDEHPATIGQVVQQEVIQ